MTRQPDLRSAGEVGRRARLELAFEVRAGRTVLGHAYAEPPFRIGHTFPDSDGGDGLHMILASSAPGLFGGDFLEQSVTVAAGARVRLTSQSALQLHPSGDGATAALTSTYRVEAGGHLRCEWDPMIPFPDARLDQRIRIDLAEESSLFWSDAFMSGREASGERWQFARLSHELRLLRCGSLDYLERYVLEPGQRSVSGRWVASAACYFGTILGAGEPWQGQAEPIHHELNAREGVVGAADALAPGLLLARLMSATGLPFHEARRRVAEWPCGPTIV